MKRMTRAGRVPSAAQTLARPLGLQPCRGPAGSEWALGRARFCRKCGFSSWPARPPETCLRPDHPGAGSAAPAGTYSWDWWGRKASPVWGCPGSDPWLREQFLVPSRTRCGAGLACFFLRRGEGTTSSAPRRRHGLHTSQVPAESAEGPAQPHGGDLSTEQPGAEMTACWCRSAALHSNTTCS